MLKGIIGNIKTSYLLKRLTSDIVNLQVQLEVMRERDKSRLEKFAQLEQNLREAQREHITTLVLYLSESFHSTHPNNKNTIDLEGRKDRQPT